jgi:hypothetical protein
LSLDSPNRKRGGGLTLNLESEFVIVPTISQRGGVAAFAAREPDANAWRLIKPTVPAPQVHSRVVFKRIKGTKKCLPQEKWDRHFLFLSIVRNVFSHNITRAPNN